METLAGALLVVLAFIIASFPAIRLLSWWSDGVIEGGHAIVAVSFYIALIAAMHGSPTGVRVLILLLIAGSAIAMPVLARAADRSTNRALDDDRLAAFVRVLETRPEDAAARLAVADELAKRGDYAQAIEHGEWVLRQHPRLSSTVSMRVESWRRQIAHSALPALTYCHHCHAENRADALACTSCGAEYGSTAGLLQRIAQEGGPKAVLRAWLVLAGALTFVSFFLMLLPGLPIVVSAAVIAATAIVAAWLFLRWVGGDLGRPAD